MKCIPYGDRAMLVNFEQVISEDINLKVIGLKHEIEKIKGVTHLIPAYCSLTIGYNPGKIKYDQLEEEVTAISANSQKAVNGRHLKIPVCYGGDFGPDMTIVTKQTGLSEKDIIEIHTTTTFRVYMMGFIPGFAYMGKLPESLECKRQEEPRRRVPIGSVGLAGLQTGIYPSEAPGGWQLIGKTPVKTFQTEKEEPFLFKTGDCVSFYPIKKKEFKKMATDVKKGTFKESLLT